MDKAPRNPPAKLKPQSKGLILVNTGNGKGKSTAAFGTALRAAGRGWKVAIVQFIKGSWKTGEEEAFKKFGEQICFFIMGEGFTWDTQNYEKDVKSAQKAWAKCRELLRDDEHRLVIFDEINCALAYNFLDTQTVIEELRRKPEQKHVFLTGRGAPEALIEIADLVTEMNCIKHPFDQGILAQPGIEY